MEIPEPEDLMWVADGLKKAIDAAIEDVRQAPSSVDSWGKLGHVYRAHGWPRLAERCYRQAVEKAPDEFRWRYYLGRSVDVIDATVSAEALGEAIKIDPNYAPAHTYYGMALITLGRFEEAEKQLRIARELDSSFSRTELGLGQIAIERGKYNDARAHFERSLELNYLQGPAHAGLAALYRMQNQPKQAQEHMDQIHTKAWCDMRGDPLWDDVAATFVRKFAERTPQGLDLLAEGKAAAAVTVLDNAIPQEREEPMYWVTYGTALLEDGKIDRSIAAFEKALPFIEEGQAPKEALFSVCLNLGVALARKGDHENAELKLGDALAIQPQSPHARFQLAKIYKAQGQLARAIRLLEQMRESDRYSEIESLLDELYSAIGPATKPAAPKADGQ
jgi:tetratricopeptide (TPR) repeat protein